MSIISFGTTRKALVASIAFGIAFSGYVAACDVVVDGSTDSSATTTVTLTSNLNNFTNSDWLNGIWRKSAGFSIPASSANKSGFVAGASVKFADGQVRKVTQVYVVGSNISVYTDGSALNASLVGYPKQVSIVSGSTASNSTSDSTSTSTSDSTSTSGSTSTTTSNVIATSSINNYTNTDWLNGVWRKSAGFSLPANSANKSAFKVGTSVKMADGQVRKILAVYLVGSNMSVYVDGAAVSGSTVGYPNKLSAVN